MYHFKIDPAFASLCPQFCGAAIMCTAQNSETSALLWNEINDELAYLQQHFDTTSIKERSGIKATRQAYRTFGKDPSRYRPACEQLSRRAIQGKGLYKINTIVDIVNLLSLHSGYAAGAIDMDELQGNTITLGIGRKDEPYEGIGRGVINIEHLPVYRDEIGAFATPTSDSTRTMTQPSTKHLLVLINAYDGKQECLKEATEYVQRLLTSYAQASAFELCYFGL